MLSFAGLLHWPDCRNVRDVGGLPALGKSRVRDRALVRADNLLRLTPAGVKALRAYGVGRVIDLRATWEMAAGAHPLAADPVYRLRPFIDEIRDVERDPSSEFGPADLYRGSLERNGRTVAAAVQAIAEAPDGAVVVHCVAGADRTGMLIALVLDILGVDRSAIMDDYARTGECLADPAVPTKGNVQPKDILEALEYVDRRHGGPREYLLRNGLSETHLIALQDRLLE
ncbi:MAG TPA: tyrosine-protein phosphatase [Mycobacteriales bacterium]|nr:tyrosine-protein phosphatase [Mycobacteriales bacterium]